MTSFCFFKKIACIIWDSFKDEFIKWRHLRLNNTCDNIMTLASKSIDTYTQMRLSKSRRKAIHTIYAISWPSHETVPLIKALKGIQLKHQPSDIKWYSPKAPTKSWPQGYVMSKTQKASTTSWRPRDVMSKTYQKPQRKHDHKGMSWVKLSKSRSINMTSRGCHE